MSFVTNVAINHIPVVREILNGLNIHKSFALKCKYMTMNASLVCLFDLILYVPSTIFQL